MTYHGFKIGDSVILSKEGVKHGLFRMILRTQDTVHGVVTGLGCADGNCIRVRVDGRKFADSYHVKFWSVEDAGEGR
jgi:DNA-directed RNA polymerase beta subunit